MNLLTHLTLALLLTLLIYANLNMDPKTLNLCLIAAALGSLIPDLDHPKAFLSRRHWTLQGTSRLIEIAFHHRGITHSLLMLIATTGIGILALNKLQMNANLAIPYAIGYLSHLLADSFNPMGVKLFQPISQWTFKTKTKIQTGGITDRILGVTLGAIFLILYAGINA
ncbi:MAG: metal-dependent hydrolase [Candidatus Altiarchaeales archaeon]|nr:metal-dependent hydrolase [Candidatus Altiarchaeales archaeon]